MEINGSKNKFDFAIAIEKMLKRRSSMHNDSLFLFSPDIIVKVISVILQSIELETLVMTNNLTHLWVMFMYIDIFVFCADIKAGLIPKLYVGKHSVSSLDNYIKEQEVQSDAP